MIIDDDETNNDWLKARWPWPLISPARFIQLMGEDDARRIVNNEVIVGKAMPESLRQAVLELLA